MQRMTNILRTIARPQCADDMGLRFGDLHIALVEIAEASCYWKALGIMSVQRVGY